MKSPGIEVGAWPILYPWSRYGDTDVRDRLCDGGSGTEKHHYSGKTSFIRKLLSRCRAYEQDSISFSFYTIGSSVSLYSLNRPSLTIVV